MMKFIIWNIMGVGSKKAVRNLLDLNRSHNIEVLIIVEPCIGGSKVD